MKIKSLMADIDFREESDSDNAVTAMANTRLRMWGKNHASPGCSAGDIPSPRPSMDNEPHWVHHGSACEDVGSTAGSP